MRHYFRWAIAVNYFSGRTLERPPRRTWPSRPDRPPVVLPYNWTGCYVGLSGGAKGIGTRDTVLSRSDRSRRSDGGKFARSR